MLHMENTTENGEKRLNFRVYGVNVTVVDRLTEVLSAKYADAFGGFAKRMAVELEENGRASRNLGGRGKCPGGYSNNLYFQVARVAMGRYAYRTVAGPKWPKWTWVTEVNRLLESVTDEA